MSQWAKDKYNNAYNNYMPWIEDKVLGYWGENKTSYTAKGAPSPSPNPLPSPSLSLPIPCLHHHGLLSLSLISLPHTMQYLPKPLYHPTRTDAPLTDKLSTDITGDKNINAVQSGVAEGVGGTLSSGGILGGVGDASSKEGVNRAERGDLDPSKAGKLGQGQGKKEKGWVEWGTGGYFGGGGK